MWRIPLADLTSGKTVAKSVARALPACVDSTPTQVLADSPAWTEDTSVKGYINSCQATKIGDAIPATYVNGISTAPPALPPASRLSAIPAPQALRF